MRGKVHCQRHLNSIEFDQVCGVLMRENVIFGGDKMNLDNLAADFPTFLDNTIIIDDEDDEDEDCQSYIRLKK